MGGALRSWWRRTSLSANATVSVVPSSGGYLVLRNAQRNIPKYSNVRLPFCGPVLNVTCRYNRASAHNQFNDYSFRGYMLTDRRTDSAKVTRSFLQLFIANTPSNSQPVVNVLAKSSADGSVVCVIPAKQCLSSSYTCKLAVTQRTHTSGFQFSFTLDITAPTGGQLCVT
jgi:hypothetical protein